MTTPPPQPPMLPRSYDEVIHLFDEHGFRTVIPGVPVLPNTTTSCFISKKDIHTVISKTSSSWREIRNNPKITHNTSSFVYVHGVDYYSGRWREGMEENIQASDTGRFPAQAQKGFRHGGTLLMDVPLTPLFSPRTTGAYVNGRTLSRSSSEPFKRRLQDNDLPLTKKTNRELILNAVKEHMEQLVPKRVRANKEEFKKLTKLAWNYTMVSIQSLPGGVDGCYLEPKILQHKVKQECAHVLNQKISLADRLAGVVESV